eukprot:352371-Chlamydomonas_euryale.AAC.2
MPRQSTLRHGRVSHSCCGSSPAREKNRRRLKDHFNMSLATASLMKAQRVAQKMWLQSRPAAAKKARNRAMLPRRVQRCSWTGRDG